MGIDWIQSFADADLDLYLCYDLNLSNRLYEISSQLCCELVLSKGTKLTTSGSERIMYVS